MNDVLRSIRLATLAIAAAMPLAPSVAVAQSTPPGTTHLRLAKIYSTVDGINQYIELEIVKVGDSTRIVLDGRTMTVRDKRGTVRVFPLGPPNTAPSMDIRKRSHILLSSIIDGLSFFADITMPPLLPIDGGTITIDGMDEFAYGRLPEDGAHALARDGSIVKADFEHWGPVQIYQTQVTEFHNAALDHYFVTNRADEIEALMQGVVPGWEPTGKTLFAFTRSFSEPLGPACRYLLMRPGTYSHFFSLDRDECNGLAGGEGNVLESSAAFHAGVPANGDCPEVITRYVGGDTFTNRPLPVYRLWNGKADANHRYVTSLADRDAMIARGWISEGSGPQGVSMCAYFTSGNAFCAGSPDQRCIIAECAKRDATSRGEHRLRRLVVADQDPAGDASRSAQRSGAVTGDRR